MAEKTVRAEVFGDSTQALISKAGTPYIKCTLVTKDENGNIADFLNSCFFPEGEGLQQLRGYLCKGRIVEVTGNYTEREYTGRDGLPKIAKDILVHSVRLGGIAEYDGGQKTTDFSFISDKDKAIADAQNKQAAQKSSKKPQQPKTKIAMPEDDPLNDPLFGESAQKEREAAAPKKGAKGAKDTEEDWNDLSDINL